MSSQPRFHGTPNDRQLMLDCAESPAGFVQFSTDRALTHTELVGCVRIM